MAVADSTTVYLVGEKQLLRQGSTAPPLLARRKCAKDITFLRWSKVLILTHQIRRYGLWR